jgi:hypothetical protein
VNYIPRPVGFVPRYEALGTLIWARGSTPGVFSYSTFSSAPNVSLLFISAKLSNKKPYNFESLSEIEDAYNSRQK